MCNGTVTHRQVQDFTAIVGDILLPDPIADRKYGRTPEPMLTVRTIQLPGLDVEDVTAYLTAEGFVPMLVVPWYDYDGTDVVVPYKRHNCHAFSSIGRCDACGEAWVIPPGSRQFIMSNYYCADHDIVGCWLH